MRTKQSFWQSNDMKKNSFYEEMQTFSLHLRHNRLSNSGLPNLKSSLYETKNISISQYQPPAQQKNTLISLNNKIDALIRQNKRQKREEWERMIYLELREQKENIKSINQALRYPYERPRQAYRYDINPNNHNTLPPLQKIQSKKTEKTQSKRKEEKKHLNKEKPIIRQIISQESIKQIEDIKQPTIYKSFRKFVLNPKSKLLRKFRIAAYCIIFINYFPKYVKKFTIQRFKHFKSKQQSYRKQLSQTIINITINLSIYQTLIPSKIIQANVFQDDIQQEQQQQSIDQSEIFSLDLPFLQQTAIQLLRQLLKTLLQPSTQLDKLSLFNFNCSFCPDQYYLMQQLYRLNVHPTLNYLTTTTPQMTKALTLFEVLAKTVVSKVLMSQQHHPTLQKRIKKQVADKEDKELYVNFFWRRLYIVGFFLYEYCMEVAEDAFKNHQGNIDQIDNGRVMMPLKPIFLAVKQKEKKKQSEEKYIVRETDYKLQSLKEYDYLENIYDFKGDISNAISYLTKSVKLSKEINIFSKKIYSHLIIERKKLYNEIKKNIFINNANEIKQKNFNFIRENQENAQVVKQIIRKLKSDD